MKKTENAKSKLKDILAWVAIAGLTALAFFLTYYYQFTAPVIALIWVSWLVLVLGAGYFTQNGKKLIVFAQGAQLELQKVVWPSRQETIQTTSIVMVMVAVTGLILWGIDVSMMWAIAKITHLG